MRRHARLCWSLAVLASALSATPSHSADPRIQSLVYDPDRVVTLQAMDGYATVVDLADDERVDSIVVGDSGAWQVSPNKRGNRVVVKASAGAPATNMIVTTDTRRYVFTLQLSQESGVTPFVMRFLYPAAPAVPTAVVSSITQYSLRGAKTLFPILMTDDGRRTTIRWDQDTPLPAISAVNEQNVEAIVNGRMIDGDYVIEGVASRYIFRRDKAQAVATRRPVKVAKR